MLNRSMTICFARRDLFGRLYVSADSYRARKDISQRNHARDDEARRGGQSGTVLDRCSFTLKTVADAHAAIENRTAVGKIVVTIAD